MGGKLDEEMACKACPLSLLTNWKQQKPRSVLDVLSINNIT